MPVISFLVFSFTLVFFISLLQPISQKINHICFEKKISGKDLLLILSTLISYIYFVSQFFYHNYFQIISVYTDNVAHRLISKELLLNLSNSFALVYRNTFTGNIVISDIFYPLGFHSLIYFISELFSVSVDLVIYYLFLFLWTILIPLTIFYASLFLTNSFRIAFIFTIIFLSTSEILLQYYYLGLWPFLIGFTASLFVFSLGLSLDGKKLLLLLPLILGLLSIYPSFSIIVLFLLLFFKLPSRLNLRKIMRLMKFRNVIIFSLVVFLLLLLIFISNIYINLLIVSKSVLIIDTYQDFSKLIELDLYINNIKTRFFDLNSSRFIILLFNIFSIFIFIFYRKFINILFMRVFILHIFFFISLLTSLLSGIIGFLNFFINPLGLIFYYDFNRIYVLYLFFSVLFVSCILNILIFYSRFRLIIYIFVGLMLVLQISSSFTDRLNADEITVLLNIKNHSSFTDSPSSRIPLDFEDLCYKDPTFICFTHLDIKPIF